MADDVETKIVGEPGTRLAELVRTGQVSAVEVVRTHLAQIHGLDDRVGAFQVVRADRALAEAGELAGRPDLAGLPLAGVPIAVKDNVPVSGEPMRIGSPVTPDAPQVEDHEVVRRLRAAGAIVVGITRMPELGIWGTTDGAFGTTRNPWDLDRTPGGSSGGSAAAVAAAMVPVAHGNDGMGSIRIPAAACGLFGIKPGSGVVPGQPGASSWFGLTENGPLATTVDDAALVLSLMADRPGLRAPSPPEAPLRIAVSTKAPLGGLRVDEHFAAAVGETADLLGRAGHRIGQADPPYSVRNGNTILAWWFAAVAEITDGLDRRRLEPRNRRHAAAGRVVRRLGMVKPGARDGWRGRLAGLFAEHDLLITPALAQPPIDAGPWSRRGWVANLVVNARYAPFAAAWNFAGYPAASVPAGRHPSGVPLAVQLVAGPGGEELILRVAKLLESARPWPGHAPLAGVG